MKIEHIIKKIIRVIIKIPVTPLVVFAGLLIYFIMSMCQVHDWLYDKGDEQSRTNDASDKATGIAIIKEWFTTF